ERPRGRSGRGPVGPPDGHAGHAVRGPAQGPLFRTRRDRDEPEPYERAGPCTCISNSMDKLFRQWSRPPSGGNSDEGLDVSNRFDRNCGPPVRWPFLFGTCLLFVVSCQWSVVVASPRQLTTNN